MPFKREQGRPPKEVQNGFKKNMARRLAFCFLAVRGGVGAQLHMCRQGFSCIEFLSYNPHPGTKEGSTRASCSTFPNVEERERGALKAASRTSMVVQWLRLCAFTVEGECSTSGRGTSARQVVPGNLLEGFFGGSGRICLPMQGMRVWSLGQKDPLEKEMATHSSIIPWEIPWVEEPGRLWSMGITKELNMIYWPNNINLKTISKIFRQLKLCAGINLS